MTTGRVAGGAAAPPATPRIDEAWAAGPAPGRRRTGRRMAATALMGVLFLAWFVWLRPPAMGGATTYAVVDGTSMEPTLVDGDLAILRRQTRYRRGTIAAFRVPAGSPGADALVIHRIVGVTGDGYEMRGDNKSGPDPWQPDDADVLGELWLHVPGAGRVVSWVGSPIGVAAVAGALTFASLAVGPGPRRRRRSPGLVSASIGIVASATMIVASATALSVAPATLARFVLPPPTMPTVMASVDIQPETLQLRSQGNPVSATIQFPIGVDPADVTVGSIRLCVGTSHCGTGGAAPTSVRVGDANGDGVGDIRARFARVGVIALVEGTPTPSTVIFTASGIVDSAPFQGADDIRLVDGSGAGSSTSTDGSEGPQVGTSPAPGVSPSPSPAVPPSPTPGSPTGSPSPGTPTAPGAGTAPTPGAGASASGAGGVFESDRS